MQILPKNEGFLFVNNRLHLSNISNRYSTSSAPQIGVDLLREQFEEFCRDQDKLKQIYGLLESRLVLLLTSVEGKLQCV